MSIKRGSFVRVKSDHPIGSRAGKDGMVVDVFDQGVGLTFGHDRYSEGQGCLCVGPEMWNFDELDLTTVEF